MEVLPIAALLAATVALAVWAEPVMYHVEASARALFHPTAYRQAVMSARQRPDPQPAKARQP